MSATIIDGAHFKAHIVITADGITALEHLAANTPLGRQKIKKAMFNGCVWLESNNAVHRIRRSKKILKPQDSLYIYYDEGIQNTKPPTAELIADEGEYSIWNKPYGMYSQGTKWGDHCTIYRWAEQQLTPQRPALLVHRLDRAATGLIILAHSKKTAAAFGRLFQRRGIQKRYRATVEGKLQLATLPFVIAGEIDNKPAVSKIIALEPCGDDRTTVSIEIETGRKHQIRKHLSRAGFPIVGDRLYGTANTGDDSPDIDLQLRSTYLQFICPVTQKVREYSITGSNR